MTSIPPSSSRTPPQGQIDNNYINQMVKESTKDGNANSEGFDPNMFLKILMSQLQNQSPFDSMDSQQIMEQQAILTQVEQSTRATGYMQEMKSTMESELATVKDSLATINQTLLKISDKL
jgi:flagellar hook assembly protein FlgD